MRHALRRRVGGRFGDERRVIGRVDEAPADEDHRQHDPDFEDDDQVIDPRRFRDAADQQAGQDRQDHDRRNVHDAADTVRRRFKWGVVPLVRYLHPYEHQHAVGVLAPRDRHGRGANGVFEHQVPADHPRHQLPHRRVGIGVGAAGDRDHRGKFGVAQSGECATHGGEQERERDRWSGPLGDGGGGADEQARADDRADAERDQRAGTERPL